MNLNELICKNVSDLSEKQIEFLNLHNDILSCGSIISNSLVNLAVNLKKMKDDELYLQAGYNSFEEYTELACGLKRRQAYNYIKVLDNLGEDFVHSNAQIGIAKLTLLTTITNEEKDKLFEDVKVEDVTVSELKQKIKDLQEQNDLKDKTIDNKNKIINKNSKDISKLKKELENASKSEVIVKDSDETLNKLKEFECKLSDTENQIQNLNNEKETLLKKIEISNSNELIEFKVLFENLQTLINRIKIVLDCVPAEKQQGCINALKKVGFNIC